MTKIFVKLYNAKSRATCMKQINPKKLRVMMAVALSVGFWGLYLGSVSSSKIITILGIVNLGLSGFFGYRYFAQRASKEKK